MADKKPSEMSDKELMREWTDFGKKVQKDKDRLREFSKEHQKRERLAQLKLTPGDLELLQGVTLEGIESSEGVGSNG